MAFRKAENEDSVKRVSAILESMCFGFRGTLGSSPDEESDGELARETGCDRLLNELLVVSFSVDILSC